MLHVEHSGQALLLRHINAPRGALEKLERYAELLSEWNQRFNLVAASTLPYIWQRHFLDSAQLLPFIPKISPLVMDMGSGAGFPGLVLSILGVDNVHLIESIGKKAKFLQCVVDELKLNAIVHNVRVDALKSMKADVITARAVGSLSDLLRLAQPISRPETICLFLKGKSIESELTEAKKEWIFSHELSPSLSDDSGSVLALRHIRHVNNSRRRTGSRKHK